MHISEKPKRKPFLSTPMHFAKLLQCALHQARNDEIGLCPMLQEYQAQLPAKTIKKITQSLILKDYLYSLAAARWFKSCPFSK
jgi:hypothetical protein